MTATNNNTTTEPYITATLHIDKDEYGVTYGITNVRLFKTQQDYKHLKDKNVSNTDFELAKTEFWARLNIWMVRVFNRRLTVNIINTDIINN